MQFREGSDRKNWAVAITAGSFCEDFLGAFERPPTLVGRNHEFSTLIATNNEEELVWIGDDILAIVIGSPRLLVEKCDATTTLSPADLFALFKEHGVGMASELAGHYALVLVDPSTETALAVTDRLGTSPVYFAKSRDAILIGSNPLTLASLQRETPALSLQALYHYLYFHMVPSPVSIAQGCSRLGAAQTMLWRNDRVSVETHWVPNFVNTGSKVDEERALEYQLQGCLKRAVNRSMHGGKKIGAFLSGGLDSSTVAGYLAELSPGQAEAFSIGFSAPGYDEMEYARITANHFGIKLHEYYVTPDDIVSELPSLASSFAEPFGNSSALPAYFCSKLARESGIEVMLAGDGGDELFAGNERYIKQAVFDYYHLLPRPIRTKIIEPLLRITPSFVPLSGKALSYVQQANVPLPDRLQTYNFLHRFQLTDLLTQDLLSCISEDMPLELQRSRYSIEGTDSLNRMMYLDWQYILADNDLVKVNQAAHLAGIQVRYPMLDDELVEFSCSVPNHLKTGKNQLRRFYKKALTGWLPDTTINKSKHGFGLPFGVWLQEHKPLQELAYENVIALKKRNILKASFLDEAIRLHRSGHAAYYGELIWVLCSLELWLAGRPSTLDFKAGH